MKVKELLEAIKDEDLEKEVVLSKYMQTTRGLEKSIMCNTLELDGVTDMHFVLTNVRRSMTEFGLL